MEDETDLANFALDYAMKKGVSYAEARYEHQEQENFILKNGVLDALYVGQDRGVGVRVLVNGALGFAATNMRTKSDVRAIVDDAIKVAKASRRKTKITFAHEDAIEMNWAIPEQRKLADVPVGGNRGMGPGEAGHRRSPIDATHPRGRQEVPGGQDGSGRRTASGGHRLPRIVRPPHRGGPCPRPGSESSGQVVHSAGRHRHAGRVRRRQCRRRSDRRATH